METTVKLRLRIRLQGLRVWGSGEVGSRVRDLVCVGVQGFGF